MCRIELGALNQRFKWGSTGHIRISGDSTV